jgi:hypothetical protein
MFSDKRLHLVRRAPNWNDINYQTFDIFTPTRERWQIISKGQGPKALPLNNTNRGIFPLTLKFN